MQRILQKLAPDWQSTSNNPDVILRMLWDPLTCEAATDAFNGGDVHDEDNFYSGDQLVDMMRDVFDNSDAQTLLAIYDA